MPLISFLATRTETNFSITELTKLLFPPSDFRKTGLLGCYYITQSKHLLHQLGFIGLFMKILQMHEVYLAHIYQWNLKIQIFLVKYFLDSCLLLILLQDENYFGAGSINSSQIYCTTFVISIHSWCKKIFQITTGCRIWSKSRPSRQEYWLILVIKVKFTILNS